MASEDDLPREVQPGFYLIAGPSWKGEIPKRITKVFRATTNTGIVGPRVAQDDTPEDKAAVQAVIQDIDRYPLAEFDGKMKRRDWRQLPNIPKPPGAAGEGEARWVFPETFFDQIPHVLQDAPPLPGEEARYAEVLALAKAVQKDPQLKAAVIDEATNEYHFFAPNELERYSIGTKNKDLTLNPDGSLTVYVQSDAPVDPLQRANWLPSPEGADFSLFMRAYWPEPAIADGRWTPPPVRRVT